MKKRNRMVILVLCFLALTAWGCEKKVAGGEIETPQSYWKTYEFGRTVEAYALDQEGSLYTIESDYAYQNPYVVGGDSFQNQDRTRWLRKYDADGEQVFSVSLGEHFVGVRTMTYLAGKLYFPAFKERETGGVWPVLFAADAGSGEWREAVELPVVKQISRVTAVRDSLYLLADDIIIEYSPVMGTFAEIKIEGAADIAATREGNLLIYAAQEEAYAFLLYRVENGTVKTLATVTENLAHEIAAGPTENSVVYIDRTNLLNCPVVYAEFSDMGQKTEIYPQASKSRSFASVNGRLALGVQKAGKDGIVTMELDKIRTGQKEIRYLTQDDASEDPYGCGFTITREKIAADKLVLKLLAQDTDFDMIHVNSRFSPLAGVRDSGCFYPLNNVPGVEEYLDCCFPYVRDAVTDEDGNIWMLPVNIDMDLMVCDTERCREQGYAFKENMTYEEFLAALGALSDEERKLTARMPLMVDFMDAYFCGHTSADTAEFRQTVERIRQITRLFPMGDGLDLALSGKYIYKLSGQLLVEDDDAALYTYGAGARVYALPKMSGSDKNVAFCRGFIVNPKSENLEQTLQYVATFAAYQMGRKNAPAFFAVPENREESYQGSLYRVYENGVVSLGLDRDLYWGYQEVLDGTRDIEDYIAETEKKLRIYFGE